MAKVVAVIGASSNRQKFGNRAVRAFQRQGYTVVPINPHEREVEGLKTYASVLDVPGAIDMATSKFTLPLPPPPCTLLASTASPCRPTCLSVERET